MAESTPAVLERKFRLHSWEVDRKGRARPDVLFAFMLDSAWAHASNSEFSYEALKEEGQLWVLSRFLAVFHKLPGWDDEITIETWSTGTDRLFGLRDFSVRSESGEKLISATSAWLVIDRKTSRIQRIDLVNSNFPVRLDRHEFETRLGKIDPMEAGRTGSEHVVRYSDIDVNNHVNSTRYLSWMYDSLPGDILDEKPVRLLEINFLAEAQLNEKVFVVSADAKDYHFLEVRRENDGAALCRAKITIG